MALIGSVGSFVRGTGGVMCFLAAGRVLVGLANSDVFAMRLHGLAFLAGLAMIAIGSWVRRKWGHHGVKSVATGIRSGWWEADLSFRLVVFLGGAWMLAAYFFQDGYGRDFGLILLPPVGAMALYFLFKTLVLGATKRPNEEGTVAPAGPVPVTSTSQDQCEEAPRIGSTPQERERLMRELTNRMREKS